MLETHKPLMDEAFKSLCVQGSASNPDTGGEVYKAAYNAYYTKASERLPKDNPNDSDVNSLLSKNGMLSSDIEKQLQEDAHYFASLFADSMNNVLKEISNQIDAHIKSAQIDIMVPTLLPTIISPMGPCTGSLSISETTGAQIIIS